MEFLEIEGQRSERWSSQQVVRQRRSSDGSREPTTWRQTSNTTKTRLLLNYPVYHRLSTLVVVANTAAILCCSLKKRKSDASNVCLEALAANLLVAILIRQEHIVNLLYYTFGLIPHSMPIQIRCHAASLYHLGGIHSGAAISAVLWLFTLNFVVLGSHNARGNSAFQNVLAIFLVTSLDILLLQMMFLSLPVFRHRYHNTWESIHHWSAWLLLLIFWLYLGLYFSLSTLAKHEDEIHAGKTFYSSPVFYMLIAMTLCNILPWLYLRRVAPRYCKLSDHAVQLFFDDWYINPCKTPKLSTSPLKEWHAFACIPYPERDGCSVLISRAGDWTSRMIDNPPEYLYIKAYPAQGVLYMAKIFKSVLCVVTGSGIAPVLGLLDIPGTKFRVLWSTRDPEKTYRQAIMQRLLEADQDVVILDTSRSGRSDLVEVAAGIYATGDNEAVFVISNPSVTKNVVKGLRRKGILAYGPIFDS